jgi:hypothetical protein
MSTLVRLQEWYTRHCDGEREHQHGIVIQSCDNPVWWVKTDLSKASIESRSFERIAENVDASGFQVGTLWLDCKIIDGAWYGAGDETKLERILEIFLFWAELQEM